MAPPSRHDGSTTLKDLVQALHWHLGRAKLVVYSSLLAVGVTQIIIREWFPGVQPPWGWIVAALGLVLVGAAFIPPLLLIVRSRSAFGKTNSHVEGDKLNREREANDR